MKEVIPYHNKKYNCVQDIVYTLARFYECEYQMLLLESWGIKYCKDVAGLSHKIDFAWNGLEYREWLLKTFHGILYKHTMLPNSDVGDLRACLDETRLGVYLDPFDCHWLGAYQMTHGWHFCLITNCDDEFVYCIDQFSKTCNEIKMSYDLLRKHKGYVKISKEKISPLRADDYLEALVENIKYFKHEKCLNMYGSYLKNLQDEELLINEILKTPHPLTSNFLMQLKFLSNNKDNYGEALGYISKQTGKHFPNSNLRLKNLAQHYNKLRAIMVKNMLLKKVVNHTAICDECKYIEDEENAFLQVLIDEVT